MLLGINGFAHNLPDGNVGIIAQGTQGALAEFIELCNLGPRGANVDSVNTVWRKPKEMFGSFEMR
jgi:acylphosphatase